MPDGPREFRMFPKHWGAELIREGEVRFRIWAPALDSLSLRIGGDDASMGQQEDGWFELVASGIKTDTPYSYVLPDGRAVPDPASRAQVRDVHGPSMVIDPTAYQWRHGDWRGRPWTEAVVYELHIGTFTSAGSFSAAAERLPHLAALGVTAVELMPVAHFAGRRGWGYDGVLPYAPHNAYGAPDDLKHLVDAAHGLGLMILLDVVYNHFGPEGNHLNAYAPEFFDQSRHTPWGAAIAYDRLPVRQFFLDNARYWIEEFNFDGLRLDAIDQIKDPTQPELLVELAQKLRHEFADRHIHLITEDNRNVAYLHERRDGRTALYTAEWNDDFHNAAHVLLTGENGGYYEDFAVDPLAKLSRCLAEGFAFQGDPSPHAGNAPRGEDSTALPTTAFIDFLQNHDQVGNRAIGERLCLLASDEKIKALTAILLLSPHIPMLFMGEEWGERRPFLFFTDYDGDLANAVREGRRREFAKFAAFADGDGAGVPDPNAASTFEASRLDWQAQETPGGQARMSMIRSLLGLRRQHIIPHLDDGQAVTATMVPSQPGVLAIDWQLRGVILRLRANLGQVDRAFPPAKGEIIFRTDEADRADGVSELRPWHVVVTVER